MTTETQRAVTIQSGFAASQNEPADPVSVKLSISATTEQLKALQNSIITDPVVPGLSTNEFVNDDPSKDRFRNALLSNLRQTWTNPATETHFLTLVTNLQNNGCTILAGLIDPPSFQHLINAYTTIMHQTGRHAFLHSFAHLDRHPEFMGNPAFSSAILHPLLVAMIAYAMGGPVRMTDARGKDTQPISVNAQDNMLHVDNSPFRQEYKLLIAWEQGWVKGPSGQNFTFLPGTNRGTRRLRCEGSAGPWSTENDSLFITEESIESVFEFQKSVTGKGPTVVEVAYPEQPIAALFEASSLVHHRYRNKGGKPRSCIIMAFHLAAEHPGSLLPGRGSEQSESLAPTLMSYHDGTEEHEFCSLLSGNNARAIEAKIWDLLDPDHRSTMLDHTALSLSGQDLGQWRTLAIKAPSASQLKFEAGVFLGGSDGHNQNASSGDLLAQRLAAAMSYDKHGVLDLILYQDNHEETRKADRKSVWTSSKEHLEGIIAEWLPAIESHQFTLSDVAMPEAVRREAEAFATLLQANLTPNASTTATVLRYIAVASRSPSSPRINCS